MRDFKGLLKIADDQLGAITEYAIPSVYDKDRYLDGLVKKADAARNRMVRANRVSKGLEPAAPKPVTDSTGRAYQPGMRVVGHGGNRAFFTPAEMSRVNADRSQFIREHPGQFAAAMAAPWLAAGAGVAGATAPAWGPVAMKAAPHVANAARTYGPQAARAWWTTGGSLMRSASPAARALGYIWRGTALGGPVAAYAAKASGYGDKFPKVFRDNAINMANTGAAPAITVATAKAIEKGIPFVASQYAKAKGKYPEAVGRMERFAGRLVDNFRKDKSVNITPTYFGNRSGTVGAAKDTLGNIVTNVPGVGDYVADAAIPAASNAYFSAASNISNPNARKEYESAWPVVEKQIRAGIAKPSGIVQQGRELLDAGKRKLQEAASGKFTPEEIDTGINLARDFGVVSPVMAQNARDVRQMFGTNDVNRVGLAKDIAFRTIPTAMTVAPDVQDAYGVIGQRVANKGRKPVRQPALLSN